MATTRLWRLTKPYIPRFVSKQCQFSTAAYDATAKILMRHFLFQIHPDYFQQHKTEQEVNSRNYASLQEIHTKLILQQQRRERHSVDSGVRTLVFYVKPTDQEPTPRRVKVFVSSLRSLEESMVDILDTAGSSLPPDIKASIVERHAQMSDGDNSSWMGSDAAFLSGSSCSPHQVVQFLDTLIDRKELMNWRQDRARSLNRLLDIVQSVLGVEAIDIRYSWSAQNNTILLESLLRLVAPTEVYQTLGCPWRGMTLVLSADDCSQLPVDPVEGHVMINPSQVPLQWMAVFTQVGHPGLLATAHTSQLEITRLVGMFNHAASTQLQLAVVTHVRRYLRAHSTAGEGVDGASVGRHHVVGLTISVRRGHTCSRRWFMIFLNRMEAAMSRVIAHHPPADPSTDDPGGIMFTPVRPAMSDDGPNDPTSGMDSGPVGDAELLPVVLTTPDTGTGNGAGTALLGEQFSFLAHLPLAIALVVEEGHGTKLLPSGELRLDCRATPEAVRDLIASKCLESLELSAKHKVLKESVDELTQAVVARLGLASVEAGVGVDLKMMEACLHRLKQHAPRRGRGQGQGQGQGKGGPTDGSGRNNGSGDGMNNTGSGKLAALAGMRVRIGRYLGIADDGSVTFPHDFPDFS